MNKKVLLSLVLLLMVVPMTWAGGDSTDPWEPNEPYAKWIHEFHVDKSFVFSNQSDAYFDDRVDDGVSVVDAPGMLCFSIVSWHKKMPHPKSGKVYRDDHNLSWAKVMLHNSKTAKDFLIADIHFDNVEHDTGDNNLWRDDIFLQEGLYSSHTDGKGCKTWKAQHRLHTEWNGGVKLCYFVTQYGDDLKKFAREAGDRLEIRVQCKWDNKDWGHHDESTSITFDTIAQPVTVPDVTGMKWDYYGRNILRLKMTNVENVEGPAVGTFYLMLNGKQYGDNIEQKYKSNSTYYSEHTESFNLNAKSQEDMENVLTKQFVLRAKNQKEFTLNYEIWDTPYPPDDMKTWTVYSQARSWNVPLLMLPKALSAKQEGERIVLEWTKEGESDNGDSRGFLLERSRTANFSKVDMSVYVPYSETSYVDNFPDFGKGDVTYYYRISRPDIPYRVSSSVKVNTNPQRITKLDVIAKNGVATVEWALSSDGLQMEDMDLQLVWGSNSTVLPLDSTSFTMTGLQSCNPINIRLELRYRQMVVNTSSMTYTQPSTVGGRIRSFEISKGFYTDHVELDWQVARDSSNFAHYAVARLNIKEPQEEDKWVQLGVVNHTNGLLSYKFVDNTCVPGEYYYYRITGYSTCNQDVSIQHQVSGIGFAQPYGIVSGQITYAAGNQAVSNVKVSAVGEASGNRAIAFGKPDTIRPMQSAYMGESKYPLQIANPLKNTDQGTVEMWVKGDWGSSNWQHLLYTYPFQGGFRINYDSQLKCHQYFSRTNNKRDYFYPGNIGKSSYLSTDKNPNTLWRMGEWNLISFTYIVSDTTYELRLYINGQEQANYIRTDFTNCRPLWRDVQSIYFGQQPNGTYKYQGEIREIRMWDVARSQAEIQANMNTAFTGSESNLAYLYRQKPIIKTTKGLIKYGSATLPADQASNLLGASSGSVEMWLNPNSITNGEQAILSRDDAYYWCIDSVGTMKFMLQTDKNTGYTVSANLKDSATGFVQKAYNHVAMTYGVDDAGMLSMRLWINGKSVAQSTYMVGRNAMVYNTLSPNPFVLGADSIHYFYGYMDELRFWNTCRDSLAIVSNMNGYLSGTENGLTAYYRFDNENTGELYDISRTNTTYNQRHLKVNGSVVIEKNILPTPAQLSLCTRSDANGNYVINAIPYTETGSTYSIVPMMGIHSFSPSQRPLYFTAGTSTHNSVNFSDKSSFRVSGHVLYENTDYPVAGCTFTVDGSACVKDNKMVETDENGYYEITVPVGSHYVEIKKAGHTFVNEGRYPEPNPEFITYYDFQEDITGLDWTDNTKVVLTGRVLGGGNQRDKQHGMQQCKNIIGTARIIISPVAKDKYDLNLLDSTITLPAPNDCAVNSRTTVAAKGTMAARHITIITDGKTGEFSALVPPIDMTVDSLTIPSNPDIYFNIASLDKLELSECDSMRYTTDTLEERTFRYLKALDVYYMNPNPSLTIHQMGMGGWYGVESVSVPDYRDTTRRIDLPLIKNGHYVYDVPFFVQDETYEFQLRCFESYVNKDNGYNSYTDLPLKGWEIRINNGFGEPINGYTNTLTTNGMGYATYQFMAGEPNITQSADGQSYRCYFSATFTNVEHNAIYDWEGKNVQGIVLGAVPIEGTNFITEGPNELFYILRDPPGSKSSATLHKGSTITYKKTNTTNSRLGIREEFIVHTGLKNKVGEGFGIVIFTDLKSKNKIGTDDEEGRGSINTEVEESTIFTTTEDISTDAGSVYVGGAGDVFIGTSSNWEISRVKNLHFVYNGTEGRYELSVDDGIGVGKQYKTTFAYSRYQLDNVQLPLIKATRNSLLTPNVSQDMYEHPESYHFDESKFHYLTMLGESDPDFGKEGTYKTIAPRDTSSQNMVLYYNNMLDNWIRWFAYNDSVKLLAVQSTDGQEISSGQKISKKNYSIDGGTNRSFSTTRDTVSGVTTTSRFDMDGYLYTKGGFQYNAVGFSLEVGGHTKVSDETVTVKDTTHTWTTTANFNLNLREQLSVDMIEGADDYGPIFSTQAGQTYCPYEGAEYTTYYKPDALLSTATQRVENPMIRVTQPVVSGIPAGGHAIYELQLSNETDVTVNADLQLMVNNTTNPHGAQLFVAGAALTNGAIPMRLQPGSFTTVLLELRQTDLEILDYEDIELRFASQCSPNATYSSAKISAHFVASCPEVKMSVNKLITNAENTTLTFRLTDYDCSVRTFTGVRLEYKKVTDAAFTQQIVTIDRDQLAKNASYTYVWDTYPLVDGEYEVRAVGVCRLGNEEILYEGAPVTITKDTAIPQALGLPSPINGIYTNDNEVYVTFNEPINTALIKETDVEVMGAMNGGDVCTDIALAAHTNGRVAETEASFVLENTGFSLEAWVRIDSLTAGSLIGIGDKYSVNVTAQGKLSVYYWIDNTRYTATSTETLPLNKWFYLCVQQELLDDGSAIVHAHCAYDSYSLTLLNEAMPAYSATVPVRVLFNFHSAVSMCELQLWREYRDWTTVLSSIYQTKELSRTGLYGYWPMHDGRGTVAKEMMRGRNLVLPGENWRYKDTNRALHISEQTMAVLDFSDKSIMGEDYALEFWFRRTEPGALYANISGVDTTYMMLTEYCDGAWHHFAVVVRHQSDSEVLIDGKPYLTSSMPFDTDLNGIFLFSPDSTAMDMDELRIWKATITPDWIKDNMRNRVRPDATGLLVNFPMEDALLADVAADALYQHPSLTSRYDSIPLTYAADAPAMVTVKNEQVVPHTYTASDTKLVINITAKPSQIEGQTLNFLVKSLPDTHNNLSKDVRWSAYVHRNLLEWDDQERTITKEVLNREQIALTFTNRSGNIESWTISGLPDWMSVSESTGSLAQLTTKTVILTIDESLAIGHYEPVIYLSGNQGIYDPLPLHIQVTGDRPNWSINPADFTYSMNIVGKMATSGGFVVDTADMVAAKIMGKLVGVAHPQVISKGGSIMVMMDIYSDLPAPIATGNNGPVVDFEYWDASTGLIHTGVQTSIRQNGVYMPLTIRFKDATILGTLMDPVQFTVGNTIRQEVDIHVGWNWYSFNVLPLDKAANEFLQPLLPYTDMVKAQDSYAEMDSIRQLLVGSLDSIDVGKCYRLRSTVETTQTLTGLYVNPTTIQIPLRRGWNWIGYVPNMTLSVGAAMANHHAEDGDIVKGQQGFSIFADGQWVGSLRAMTPGAGYMYYSNSLWPTGFYYPSPAAVALAPMRMAAEEDNLHYNPISRSEFSSNMTVTAIVMDGDTELPASTLEVAVFAGNQCRTAMRGTDDRFFLTIPGDDAADLQFRVWDGVSERVAKQTISFESDAQYGTYRQPYIIRLGEMSEGLDAVDDRDVVTKVIINDVVYIIRGGKWYDVLGHKVNL